MEDHDDNCSDSDVAIRYVEEADAQPWRALWAGYNAFYEAGIAEDITRSTWSRLLDPSSPMLGRLALHRGVPVGFTNAVLHPSTWTASPSCYLEDLFVDPNIRGAGIGRRLIDDLVALCRANGWSRLYWHTRSGNARARRLYDSYGPADDFVRYQLELTDAIVGHGR